MKRYVKASTWDDSWRYKIPGEVLTRLGECRSTWEDAKIMGKAMKEANPDRDAEDCAVRIMDWLDSNNQFFLLDLTSEQHQEFIDYINTAVDFNEVYNEAYNIYAETQDNRAVIDYICRHGIQISDAMQMLKDIAETYDL